MYCHAAGRCYPDDCVFGREPITRITMFRVEPPTRRSRLLVTCGLNSSSQDAPIKFEDEQVARSGQIRCDDLRVQHSQPCRRFQAPRQIFAIRIPFASTRVILLTP